MAMVGGCAQGVGPRPVLSGTNHVSASITTVHAGATLTPAPNKPVTLDDVVATVNGRPLTMRQLVPPLIEAHGLVMLMNLVRLETVKQWAARDRITINADDIAKQRQITLDAMFKDSKPDQQNQEKLQDALAKGQTEEAAKIQQAINFDREEFLNRLLEEQHLSRTDFELILQINAYLRKEAEPKIKDRITEENIRAAFGQLFGETARARYVELLNMEQVNIAKRRLDSGEKFEDVARDMSVNRISAANGGEMPPFSRAATNLPENFKEVTFALKPGEVSDPISLGPHFVLVKLIEKVPPKAVKFETVKESVRAKLYESLLTATMNDLRRKMDTEAIQSVKIEEPTLKKQFQQAQDRQVHDRDKMNQAMERDRLLNDVAPATAPSTNPALGPIAPAIAPAPATQPGPATRPASRG